MLVSISGTWMESACHPDQAPAGLCLCNAAAVKLRLREHLPAVTPWYKAEANSRYMYMLVFASETWLECLPS